MERELDNEILMAAIIWPHENDKDNSDKDNFDWDDGIPQIYKQ